MNKPEHISAPAAEGAAVQLFVECPTCGGSGFSSPGTGYGDVCSECGGQRFLPYRAEGAAGGPSAEAWRELLHEEWESGHEVGAKFVVYTKTHKGARLIADILTAIYRGEPLPAGGPSLDEIRANDSLRSIVSQVIDGLPGHGGLHSDKIDFVIDHTAQGLLTLLSQPADGTKATAPEEAGVIERLEQDGHCGDENCETCNPARPAPEAMEEVERVARTLHERNEMRWKAECRHGDYAYKPTPFEKLDALDLKEVMDDATAIVAALAAARPEGWRRAVIEECAKVADDKFYDTGYGVCVVIRDEIRALAAASLPPPAGEARPDLETVLEAVRFDCSGYEHGRVPLRVVYAAIETAFSSAGEARQ